MNNIVLVTGASGFIGSHLVEALVVQGFSVRALVHYNSQNRWGWLDTLDPKILMQIEVISSDIRDPHAVRKAIKGCRLVFHLAALIAIPYSYIAPASYIETNVIGTANILQASLDEHVERVIHTSTSETYGTAQMVPIDETHPIVAQSPYAATKIAADKLAESYYLSFNLPVSTIRPFNTYGPRQSARAIIPTIISQVISGADTILLGSLSPERDLTYVKDTVQGFIAIAQSEDAIGNVINVGSGKSIRMGELAQMILSICDSKAEIRSERIRVRPDNSEVFRLICDNSKANSMLGWRPRYGLKEGITETITWFKSNSHQYKSNIYNL